MFDPHRGARPRSTVYLVEDDAGCSRALAAVLRNAGYGVVACASAEEFLRDWALAASGCVIMDVHLPGMSGLGALEELARRGATVPVIVLSGAGDIPMAVDAMERGAFTFLPKPVAPAKLLEKVERAVERDASARRRLEEAWAIRECYGRLTHREREVVALLAQGKTARTIARILGTAESTVRVQRASILKKMHADSPTDLLRMLVDAGLAEELLSWDR